MRISIWFRPLIARLSRPRPRRLSQRPAFRPRLEGLEDRLTPSGGLLDPTFGSGGIVNLPSTTDSGAHDVVVQPDGKIVIAGTSKTSTGASVMSMERLNPNGTLDTTFNQTGTVTIPGASDGLTLALQPDGKILIGGDTVVQQRKTKGIYTYVYEPLVARLNSNGTLDTTFGNNGLSVIASPGKVEDLAVLTDPAQPGTVTGIVGAVFCNNFEAIKLTPAGLPDQTFGSGGVAKFANLSGISTSVAVNPLSGEIYLVGEIISDSAGALAALSSTGTLDTSFGGGAGYVLANSTQFSDVAVQTVSVNGQPVSRVLVAGQSLGQAPAPALVDAYTVGGALDTTFGSGGSFTLTGVAGGTAQGFESLVVEADGSIVLGGSEGYGTNYNEMLFGHLTASGVADTSFGSDGTGFTVVQDGNDSGLFAVAIDPTNGDIVAGGFQVNSVSDAAVIRLTAP